MTIECSFIAVDILLLYQLPYPGIIRLYYFVVEIVPD